MKNMLFIVLVLITGNVAIGQMLEFSQVLLIDNNVQTVPSGKVWKLESCLYSSTLPSAVSSGSGSGTYSTLTDLIQVNGQNNEVRTFRSGGGYYHASSAVWEQKWPLWLPAGTTLRASTGVYRISVIEFTVVP